MTAQSDRPFPFASVPRRQPKRPELRIGDAERADACEQLNRHFTAGRLTHDELEERLTTAVGARTDRDLQALFLDLPQLPAVPAPTPTPPVQPPVHPFRLAVAAVAAVGGVLVIPIVLVMLLGAMFMGPWIFVFCLIGGTLAALSGASLTRLVMLSRQARPRSGPSLPPDPRRDLR